jgi:predicted dehydrogenase
VYDLSPERAESVAADHHTFAVANLPELLQGVDAVTIATSTSAHFAVACTALEAGKHVFLEKPITETTAEAEHLCRLANLKGLTIQVGHIERFNPAILALEGYEIKPMFVESHRLAQFNPRGTDVAVVLDLMIHDIDIILSFVQSPVAHVEANGVAVVSDSLDIANARLQFENGCVANVTASRISQRKMRKMRLFQPSGYISIDFSEGLAEVFRLVGEDEPETKGTMMLGELGSGKYKRKIVYEQPEVKEVNALRYELEQFAEAIAKGKRPVVSGEDGKRALEVAAIILEKIGQQKMPV